MKPFFLFLLLFPCIAFAQNPSLLYVCPPCGPCDTLVFQQPGKCPHCGMELISKDAKDTANNKRTTICFYLYDGVEVLDFAGPMEVFSYAGFKVFTVAKTHAPLLSQGILKITPEYSIQDAPPADVFAIFGGQEQVAADDPEVIDWIKSRDKSFSHYFSVCTGAFVLGKAGLLDGLTVTTFHSAIPGLQKQVPKAKVLQQVRYVDNGRVITTAGISAGIDGALHLVAKLKSREEALRIAQLMEYDKYVPEQGLMVSHPKTGK